MTSRSEETIMRIYLDLETVPSQAPDARELVKAGIKPPAHPQETGDYRRLVGKRRTRCNRGSLAQASP